MSSRLRTRLRAGTGLSTPSLSLEFQTATGALDPRITFSRTSQATLVDSTGKLTYAPNNLMLNSETFEAASWTAFETTVTANATTAPNGTTTADKLSETTANNIHIVYPTTPVNAVAGGVYIISVYAKASERSWLYCFEDSGTNANAFFNLSNGTIGTVGAGSTAAITSVGNGWYRCSITYTQVGSVARPRFSIATGNNTSSYTGTAGSGIFLWGAQLEQVTYQTTPGTYNSTSPKNLLGYTQEFDNAAWTKSNAFVQTNLVQYSEQFDNAYWQTLRGTLTANAAASPTGVMSADRFTEDATTNTRSTATSSITITSGATYTGSCYLKNIDRRYVSLLLMDTSTGLNGFLATFDLQNGTATTQARGTGTVASASIVDVGGGWYRCSVTGTAPTTTALFFVSPATTATPTQGTYGRESYLGDGVKSFLLWGAQLVQGSTAGDYQRTDAAAAAVQYVAPDGSRTAELMNATAGSVSPLIFQNTAAVASSAVISFYAKAGTYGLVQISSEYGSGYYANFDLNNGVVGSRGASCTDSTITALGNGWYRISATLTAYDNADISLIGSTTATIRQAFTAAGTETVYIWGAQLSNSASLDPYVYNPVAAPTSAAYYGPRFDYDPVTLANKGLLIEEQRTNLLLYSQQFDNAYYTATAQATAVPNSTISPDGTNNAYKLREDSTPSAAHLVGRIVVANTQAVANYCASVFVKQAGRTEARLRLTDNATGNISLYVNLLNGSVISSDAGTWTNFTYGVQDYGNGWYRIWVAGTKPNATAETGWAVYPAVGGSITYNGNGTDGIYIYGGGVESGLFPTSYIPTVASQVTRTADVALMQGANFSNWYNQNEGTLKIVATLSRSTDNFGAGTLLLDSNNFAAFYFGGVNSPRLLVRNAGTFDVNVTGSAQSSPYSQAMALQNGSISFASNGTLIVNSVNKNIPLPTTLQIGYYPITASYANGHIQNITYYPTRLANAQLQSLTAQSTIPSLSLDFTTQVFNVG